MFIEDNMGKKALVRAMRKHGLTATKVIKPIVEALTASKVIVHNGDNPDDSWTEEVPDHAVQLRAAQVAIGLLQLTKDSGIEEDSKASKMVDKALKNGDEVELQRILFNKKDTRNQVIDNSSEALGSKK